MSDVSPSVSRTFAPLVTKLFPANAGGRPLLVRKALLERLFAVRQQRLMVLSAPAGFGKSTVLSQFRLRLQAAGACVAWLTCDESDSEPQRLLRYLIAAIGAQLPGFGSHTAGLMKGHLNLPLEALADAFLVDLRRVEVELYLMLDDFHRIRDAAMGPLVSYFVERIPGNVHVIASTRYIPGFVEEQAAAPRPWLARIDADELRLSRAETDEYLREIKQLPLSSAEVDLLHGRTEGWITALHLASLSLARHPDRAAFLAGLSGTERNIADYLSEDVLHALPTSLQRFLEQTSLLDEFDAELCDALTARSDSQQVLQRLQREQLFIIPLDSEGQWFRYHPLFAEFLQGSLSKHGDPTHLLHAAARWCENHGLPSKAIKYALRARDYGVAAQLLERQGARLIADNRVYGVLAMLKGMPAEVICEHPIFQIFYAWQLAFEQKYAESEALIEEVSGRLLQGHGDNLHHGLVELLAAAQVLKALVLLYQDKLDSCLKVACQWLSLVPENQPVFRASLSCIQAAAYASQGEYGEAKRSISVVRGCLRQTESTYLHVVASLIETLICKESGALERGRALAERARGRVEQLFGRRSRVGGPLALAYADLLYEQDRHAAILAELPLATTWRDVATPVELISRGKLVLARARFFAGEAEQALADLDEWLETLHGPGYERVYALGMCCKVQFLLWLQRPNEAERICLQLQRHLPVQSSGGYGDASTAMALAQARLALSERLAAKAQAVLEACLTQQTAAHQRDRRFRLNLLLAVAYWRKGNRDKAFALLAPTLEDAWLSGYRRMFLDDALWLLPLMEAWIAAEAKPAPVWQGLLAQLREQCSRLAVDPDSFDENQDISHREREILRFVAAGLSNRDIAQTVHLSEATIKWHLHNLFAKLGVRSRTQAVIKGKGLGVLSEA